MEAQKKQFKGLHQSAAMLLFAIISTLPAMPLQAQLGAAPPPIRELPPGREGAPVDLTGTWVSIVSEDWRWRMTTPLIGDFANIPENAAAREFAMAWQPENDAGNECLAYGAPGIMHRPGRIRISWQDDQTLQLDFDAGRQQRLFHFGNNPPPAGAPSRQGYSLARWQGPVTTGGVFGLGLSQRAAPVSRAMQVHTSNLLPGYLRKNGIPHSADATVSEYFEVLEIADGSTWLFVTIAVEDPTYLNERWITSMNFRKEADDSRFSPEDCYVIREY